MADGPKKRRRTGCKTKGPQRHSWDEEWAEKEYDHVTPDDRRKACDNAVDILTREHVERGMSAYTFCIVGISCDWRVSEDVCMNLLWSQVTILKNINEKLMKL